KAGRDYDALGDAARCRSEADWLVGMNATRAVTVARRNEAPARPAPARQAGRPEQRGLLYSIGRVQTPTLAIVVNRERAITAFRPQNYWEVRGRFSTAGPAAATFVAGWSTPSPKGKGVATRLAAQGLAGELVARTTAHGTAADPLGPIVERVKGTKSREAPPQLFDLTTLQRTANRRWGMSATRTLEIAQALYERHKLLTYPRTDSRHLSSDLADELPKLFRGLAQVADYRAFAETLLAAPPTRSKRVFDDAKVHDHHAIIPTGKAARLDSLADDERRIFDLVARRFLGAFYPDAEFALTDVAIRVGTGVPAADVAVVKGPPATDGVAADEALLPALPPPPDRFHARGRVRLVAGWQEVAQLGGPTSEPGRATKRKEPAGTAGDGEPGEAEATLPVLAEGQRLDGVFESMARQTKPPPRHTEATLLGAMEYAGRDIADEALRAAMKDTGLGTPATRAATIETLVKRGFVIREGKQVVPTATGIALIEGLPVASLASPELTGAWEARLARVARGQEARAAFMSDIVRYVGDVVDAIRGSTSAAPRTASPAPMKKIPPVAPAPAAAPAVELVCPRCKQAPLVTGKRGWGCARWREGCSFVIWFETAGRRLSEAQLRELVSKGKTRKATWNPTGTAG
ncbi:MAG TPA: DNA topoisomerase, partial [Burkholderiaceae bacterium]|nr:DNA topoisomerase [Burkholderiaceae bacterium]